MSTYIHVKDKDNNNKKTDISREQHSKQANVRQEKLAKVRQKV